MKKRFLTLLLAAGLAVSCFCGSTYAFAYEEPEDATSEETETAAESEPETEEADLEDETETEAPPSIVDRSLFVPDASKSAIQQVQDSQDYKVNLIYDSINTLCSMDESEVNQDDVRYLITEYATLPYAAKVRVSNFWKLLQIQIDLGISVETSEEESYVIDTEDTKLGNTYIFAVDNTQPMLSLSIKYITDSDSDGVAEMPDIILENQFGSSYIIQSGNSTFTTDDIVLTASWEEMFVQLDIMSAEQGLWRVTTSNTVYFTKMAYAGAGITEETAKTGDIEADAGETPEEAFIAEETMETEAEAEMTDKSSSKGQSVAAARFKALMPLVISIIACIGIVILIYSFFRRKSASGKNLIGAEDSVSVLDSRCEVKEKPEDEEEADAIRELIKSNSKRDFLKEAYGDEQKKDSLAGGTAADDDELEDVSEYPSFCKDIKEGTDTGSRHITDDAFTEGEKSEEPDYNDEDYDGAGFSTLFTS